MGVSVVVVVVVVLEDAWVEFGWLVMVKESTLGEQKSAVLGSGCGVSKEGCGMWECGS